MLQIAKNHRSLALFLALLIPAVFVAGVVGQQAGRVRAQPTAVAVVDIEAVFAGLQEKTLLEANMQSQAERVKTEHEQAQNDLRSLQGDLDLLDPAGEAYRRKQAEVQQAVIQFQVTREYHNQRLARTQVGNIEHLYRKTLDAAGRVATDNGYDLVIFKEKAPDFTGANAQQISTQIQVRKLLWSSDRVDLTQQVTQRMNSEFNNAR